MNGFRFFFRLLFTFFNLQPWQPLGGCRGKFKEVSKKKGSTLTVIRDNLKVFYVEEIFVATEKASPFCCAKSTIFNSKVFNLIERQFSKWNVKFYLAWEGRRGAQDKTTGNVNCRETAGICGGWLKSMVASLYYSTLPVSTHYLETLLLYKISAEIYCLFCENHPVFTLYRTKRTLWRNQIQ